MSASNSQSTWNFRVSEKRLIIIKTKNETVRKAAVLDRLTNLNFAVEIPKGSKMEALEIGKEYLVDLKVFTSKNIEGVQKDFVDFF
jgi:hypothetical protein